MSCFCSVQEEFYCEVLLLDESKLILTTQQQGIKKSTKGSVVLDYVFSHVNLAETEYFGLRYCDCSHQTYWLDPSKTLAEHKDLITTGPPFTLYFGVKFYAEDPCKLKEEITRYEFFLQVKQDVLQGRLPCPFNISTQLGALAIQSELGDYDPYKHTPGYVSEYRFVPDQNEELEDSIEQIHKTLMGQVPAEAENNYLAIAKTLEMYGVDLHPVFGEKQSEYFLGLTPVGVVVYKNKTQVGKYFWPRMTKVHFKETQFELRVIGRDCNETSFFFDAPSKTACKNLWKCCVEHHTFFSGKTAMQIGREQSVTLPRPDLQVSRTRSKTYPKRSTQPAGELHLTPDLHPPYIMMNDVMFPDTQNTLLFHFFNISYKEAFKKPRVSHDMRLSGLYNSCERNKSPKAHRRSPSGGSANETSHSARRRRGQTTDDPQANKQYRRRSRSRGNTSSGSESENSNREHRKKRNRSRQENEMVDSGPQWEVVLRRQKEKTPNDPNHRRSRHRSRSRSPDIQAKEQLWKHIQKELIDPSGLSEEQLKEIPYKKVETQGDPIKIRHSHSPRSFRQYRRSHCSDGERSVLSEVNARTDLVPPLPVTRTADVPGSSSTPAQKKKGSKDTLSESSEQDAKSSAKVVKTVHTSREKTET
ncbi:band 4.1-like protein 4 [Sinocyclocheilus grahami]|uniref:band 4.1-like protein 4 n=1 Tax=Sinocyclocheilus grahami TaxID=75366 RepID=UPI0007AC9095|nr:PREDICTED: band 4.1-like protein 4 [Sinocyclocheilus grahami]